MHTAALMGAVKYFLESRWTLLGDQEVRITSAPGKPVNMQGPWAVTVHDLPQTFEGINGFYPRFGCGITFSAKLDGAPAERPEEFLRQGQVGFIAIRDALGAFLHKNRYEIRTWADILAGAMPLGGIVTGMVEAARPLTATAATPQTASWWGETTGKILSAAGQQPEAQTIGYSSTIIFGGGLTMQTEAPIER